jgi:hypothetical protein
VAVAFHKSFVIVNYYILVSAGKVVLGGETT